MKSLDKLIVLREFYNPLNQKILCVYGIDSL